jgi:dipeptidase E
MKVFLNGGGNGNQTIDTYKEINKIIDHSKPVLYVPLAMDEEEHPYDDCFKWIKNEISVIDIPNIEMVRTFNELYEKDYNNYSMIFIGGGNTFKLLKGIKESNCFNKLKGYIYNDGIVFGSSAGAVIFGKDINSIEIMDENDVELKDTNGFNLLNGKSLFVHYTNYKSKLTDEENKELTEKYTNFLIDYTINNENVIAYPEENTIFIDGDSFKMIGNLPYYIFKDGNKEKNDIE